MRSTGNCQHGKSSFGKAAFCSGFFIRAGNRAGLPLDIFATPSSGQAEANVDAFMVSEYRSDRQVLFSKITRRSVQHRHDRTVLNTRTGTRRRKAGTRTGVDIVPHSPTNQPWPSRRTDGRSGLVTSGIATARSAVDRNDSTGGRSRRTLMVGPTQRSLTGHQKRLSRIQSLLRWFIIPLENG